MGVVHERAPEGTRGNRTARRGAVAAQRGLLPPRMLGSGDATCDMPSCRPVSDSSTHARHRIGISCTLPRRFAPAAASSGRLAHHLALLVEPEHGAGE